MRCRCAAPSSKQDPEDAAWRGRSCDVAAGDSDAPRHDRGAVAQDGVDQLPGDGVFRKAFVISSARPQNGTRPAPSTMHTGTVRLLLAMCVGHAAEHQFSHITRFCTRARLAHLHCPQRMHRLSSHLPVMNPAASLG